MAARSLIHLALLASAAAADVGAILRDSMQIVDNEVKFDARALDKNFPNSKRAPLHERVSAGVVQDNLASPGILLDLAFNERVHSKPQQELQAWIFERCARLPSSGSATGLRRECTKRLATFAAALQSESVVAPAHLRAEAVVATGLSRRATYMASGGGPAESEAASDVQQATAAAKADPELQQLLQQPGVAAALEAIAADPRAIEQYANRPDVKAALDKLNGLLTG